MKRAIHIFPDFTAAAPINAYRSANDPLAEKIPPHITLVFPFDDRVSTQDLVQLIREKTRDTEAFELGFGAPFQTASGHTWLPVSEGRERVTAIHQDLYRGPLQDHLRHDRPYSPHVTLGRKGAGLEKLREQLDHSGFKHKKHRVDSLILEGITESEASVTIEAFRLKTPGDTPQAAAANRPA